MHNRVKYLPNIVAALDTIPTDRINPRFLEDANHVLIKCPFATIVWEWVLRWCDIPSPSQFSSILDINEFVRGWVICQRKRNTMISICYGTLWWIWKARCDRVFKNLHVNATKVVDNIKSQVFT
uniref:Reverse transcriptase zinc-binding domain-containing protein n=1 Tax=Lactuca sativa TaxID=4236 RepID=A0A9R1VC40_LACSA|nr:hypothetical protein LSAT_V11C600338510 [Lactuca sativa]